MINSADPAMKKYGECGASRALVVNYLDIDCVMHNECGGAKHPRAELNDFIKRILNRCPDIL